MSEIYLGRRDFLRAVFGLGATAIVTSAPFSYLGAAIGAPAEPEPRGGLLTPESVGRKYGVNILRPGEKLEAIFPPARNFFTSGGIPPEVVGEHLSQQELKIIERALLKVPYLAKLVNNIAIVDFPFQLPPNIDPSVKMSAFTDSGEPIPQQDSMFNGLCEFAHDGRANVYLFRPSGVQKGLVDMDSRMEIGDCFYGGSRTDWTVGDTYEALLIHELGHAFQNWAINQLGLNEEEFMDISSVASVQRGGDPLTQAFLQSWNTTNITQDERGINRTWKRGDTSYSVPDLGSVEVTTDSCTFDVLYDGEVPDFFAQKKEIPKYLKDFPFRAIHGPIIETFPDMFMLYALGFDFPPQEQDIRAFFAGLDQAFQNDEEEEYIADLIRRYPMPA